MFGGHRQCGSGDMILGFHVILWLGTRQCKSPSCHVWWPYSMWFWRYNGFSIPHDLGQAHDPRVM